MFKRRKRIKGVLQDNFRESWRTRNYFVVHIPKTGGTSLFGWLCQVFGPHRCREHIESMVLPTPPSPEAIKELLGFQVIAGHLPIDCMAYFAAGTYTPMTIIREPADQFFSHVNHILADTSPSPLLNGIREKARISTGYLLEHASDEELGFFENPQSKPIFGGRFDWRAMTLAERLAWLRVTYAAITTTGTMGEELGWMLDEPAAFPRLNTKQYRRDPLTSRQQSILDGMLHEDQRLHDALLQAA